MVEFQEIGLQRQDYTAKEVKQWLTLRDAWDASSFPCGIIKQ